MWSYIIIYKANYNYYQLFFQKIAKQIKEIPNIEENYPEIILLMKDINRYLQNENKTNFNAKQQELGFKALFCRYIIEE